jgi:hypothetical protein
LFHVDKPTDELADDMMDFYSVSTNRLKLQIIFISGKQYFKEILILGRTPPDSLFLFCLCYQSTNGSARENISC